MATGQYSLADAQAEQPKGQYSMSEAETEPDTYQAGAAHAITSDVGNLLGGLPRMLAEPFRKVAIGWQGRGQEFEQNIQGAQAREAGQQAAGYGPVYRKVTSPLAEGIGVNVPAMEESAAHGDVSGVLGRTVVPAAMAVAPLAAEGALRGAHEIIPSYKRAGGGLGAMDQRYASLEIKPQQSSLLARQLMDKLERTGTPVPPQLRAFVERSQVADLPPGGALTQELAARGMPTQNPLTFPEAREFRTAINELKFDKAYSPLRAQLGEVARRLDQDIRSSSPHEAFLKDYNRFNKEYSRASWTERNAEKVGGAVGATAGTLAGYELGRTTGVPHAPWVGGGIGYKLGEPVIGAMTRSILERSAEVPKLTDVPKPPTAETPTIAGERRTSGINMPEEMERRTGERRTDPRRAMWENMTPEQRYQEFSNAFVDPLTGAANRRALDVAPKAPAYAFTDVAGLKYLNDNPEHGMGAGDALLTATADAFKKAGLDPHRYGGDEFAHPGQSQAELAAKLELANRYLQDEGFKYTAPNGKTYEISGVSVRHGLGNTLEEAMQGMEKNKIADKSRGKIGTLKIREVTTK